MSVPRGPETETFCILEKKLSSEVIRPTAFVPVTTEVEKTEDTEALKALFEPVSEKNNMEDKKRSRYTNKEGGTTQLEIKEKISHS